MIYFYDCLLRPWGLLLKKYLVDIESFVWFHAEVRLWGERFFLFFQRFFLALFLLLPLSSSSSFFFFVKNVVIKAKRTTMKLVRGVKTKGGGWKSVKKEYSTKKCRKRKEKRCVRCVITCVHAAALVGLEEDDASRPLRWLFVSIFSIERLRLLGGVSLV